MIGVRHCARAGCGDAARSHASSEDPGGPRRARSTRRSRRQRGTRHRGAPRPTRPGKEAPDRREPPPCWRGRRDQGQQPRRHPHPAPTKLTRSEPNRGNGNRHLPRTQIRLGHRLRGAARGEGVEVSQYVVRNRGLVAGRALVDLRRRSIHHGAEQVPIRPSRWGHQPGEQSVSPPSPTVSVQVRVGFRTL